VVTRAAGQAPKALAITAATAVLAFTTRLNPLWLFAIAAALGLAGLV